MTDTFIYKIYDANSIGAMRCEKIVSAILSDIKGEPVAYSMPRSFKTYLMYSDANGRLDVTVYAKYRRGRFYTVTKRDERRRKCMVLDVHIRDDGQHSARVHTWAI